MLGSPIPHQLVLYVYVFLPVFESLFVSVFESIFVSVFVSVFVFADIWRASPSISCC